MKLSLGKRRVVIAVCVAAVVLVGLAVGRSTGDEQAGKLDAEATQACGELAEGYPGARGKTARLALADRVSTAVAGSDNEVITDRVGALGRSANDSDAAWRSAADALTQACRDAGWS